MKVVRICIGSACHLKGNREVIEMFQELIHTYHLEDKLELKAAFCTGHCTEAIAVQRWDGKILSANAQNARQLFIDEILPYVLAGDETDVDH